MSPVTITALHIYPIKSCRGYVVDRALVTPRGLEHDRLMMLTDEDGLFLTQREHPRMALIEPTVGEELLTLRAPGIASLDLPMRSGGTTSSVVRSGGTTSSVVVWNDSCWAIDQGETAATWLSDYLNSRVRLVHIADDFRRPVDPRFARSIDDQTSFSDGFPFLLIGEESLADLNNRLTTPLPMNRFRPNIVVNGGGAFAEDGWKQIQIGSLTFDLAKPCARCQITTIDQETGKVAGPEPLATFATFRRSDGGKVLFGQNMLSTGTGMIAVGDRVHIKR